MTHLENKNQAERSLRSSKQRPKAAALRKRGGVENSDPTAEAMALAQTSEGLNIVLLCSSPHILTSPQQKSNAHHLKNHGAIDARYRKRNIRFLGKKSQNSSAKSQIFSSIVRRLNISRKSIRTCNPCETSRHRKSRCFKDPYRPQSRRLKPRNTGF